MTYERLILHVDMDAFFASVAVLDDPSLRGKPVLVGGSGLRGVVSAASYEARAFGCHSAQPMAVARRLCPHAVVVKGSYDRYREIADQVFEILGRYSPSVQPISIDEAFLDCTGCQPLFGDGRAIATRIRADVLREVGLVASIGVAPNKFLAKLASDLDKPDGLFVIETKDIDTLLPTLPVGRIWGIGGRSVERLAAQGVRTIGDLRRMPGEFFKRRFGSLAERIHRLAHGIDDREVHADREAKSIGQEQTFGVNLADPQELRDVLLTQAEQVGRRLRKHGRLARTVTVKIRFGDFQTLTRRRTMPATTDLTRDLFELARELFDEWAAKSFSPVRLIGMSCSDLTDERQMNLFDEQRFGKHRKVDAALDAIQKKFGNTAIHRGQTKGRVREDTPHTKQLPTGE